MSDSQSHPARPNLIVIGAMKSGTTSLHDYLSIHPEIFMSRQKELDYFLLERNFARGISWYEDQFDAKYPIRGESSQNYSKRHHFKPGIVDRLADCVPDAKLIYVVRDPVKRIESHYTEAMEGGYAPDSDLEAFLFEGGAAENHYVKTSSYHFQLSWFLKRFSMDQILVVESERLKTERLQTMNEVFRFLGLEGMQDASLFEFQANTAGDKRADNVVGRFLKNPISAPLRALLPRSIKSRARSSSLIASCSTTPVEKQFLSQEASDAIREVLADDVAELRALTGMTFPNWSL
ncbi:sulfotransferase domain-containing protein [Rhodopirellula bahusiensis]|uniref:sulfotransferase domain-containing protein n=1 Tax=Rhodopirellula bahusiensis TaxID=2014065 RepID=UPI0032649827